VLQYIVQSISIFQVMQGSWQWKDQLVRGEKNGAGLVCAFCLACFTVLEFGKSFHVNQEEEAYG